LARTENLSIQATARSDLKFTKQLRILCQRKSKVFTDVSMALAPVVQKLDSAIHWINLYPVDNAIGFPSTYPLDSDLSGA